MRVRVGSKGGRARVAAAVAAGIVAASACSREQPPGPASSDEQPLQITRNFTTTESDSGVVRYVLRARIARFYSDDVTRLENLEVDFYDDGRKASVLRSHEGFRDADGRLRAADLASGITGAIISALRKCWSASSVCPMSRSTMARR